MAPTPIDQEAVFYTSGWNKAIEDEFLGHLVDEVLLGTWDRKGGNANAIRTAMREVNYKFNQAFDFKYCRVRLGRLKNRYRVFQWIVSLSVVVHDEVTNKVTTSDDAWDFICEKEKLAACYIENGETQYESLRCLFEDRPDPVDEEARHVIDIASDGVDNDFEIPVYIPEEPAKEDMNFWGYVAEEFNVPSVGEVQQTSAMSSTAAVIAKIKKPVPSGGQVCNARASTSAGSTASFSPLKK